VPIQVFSGTSDSCIILHLKNRVEIGTSFVNFFEQEGFKYLRQKNQVSLVDAMYMKYGYKVSKKIEIGISRYWFGQTFQNPDDSLAKGAVLKRYYKNSLLYVRYDLAKNNPIKSIDLIPSICIGLNYRYNGTEEIFLKRNSPTEIVRDGTILKSFGAGIEFNLDVIVKKHFFIGSEVSYVHYFQKNGLSVESPNSAFYKRYKPNRNLVVFHPKIGILF
jgi:hypothetical protein